MKSLNLSSMTSIVGGQDCFIKLRRSDLVCGGVGFLYGLVNPVLGAAVGLGCAGTWDAVESGNPVDICI